HRRVAWLGHSMGGLVGTYLDDRTRDRIGAVVTIGAPLFAGPASLRRLVAPDRAVAAARFAHARGFRFEGRRWSGLLYASRRRPARARCSNAPARRRRRSSISR